MSLLETIKSCWIFKDLRKKIIFTVLILIFFRIGSNVPIPGINVDKDNSFANGTDTFFGMMSMLGGGNLRRFSIFSLSVSPYVLATIIVQLLSADIIPSWTKLSKSGERGKKQLDLIARFLTIFIAVAQGFALVAAMQSKGVITSTGFFPFFNAVLILLFGSIFSIWLADQISEYGIGNGTSMIIFSGIVANIPWNFFLIGENYFSFKPEDSILIKSFLGVLNMIIIIILLPTIMILTIYLTQSVRKIPVQQLGSGMDKKKSSLDNSYIMLKINSSGVIPVIFASSLMSIPLTIAQFFVNDKDATHWIQLFFSMSYVPGLILYFVLVVLFTFFYSSIVIKPAELAKNFQKHGSFIPGVSPGTETKFYIFKILGRLNFLGGFSLAFIASTPYIIFMIINVPSSLSIGGTGMIIMVGVGIDVVSQIHGRIIQKKYATLSDKSLINVQEKKLNFSDFESNDDLEVEKNIPLDKDKKSLLW